jgi:hypothetical protein
MPQRGGWWPECLGTLIIMLAVFGAGVGLGHVI